MPFLFERIDDYTELLMPDDLLSEQLHPAGRARGDDAGSLPGCGGHRLALPVLHLREEGRGLWQPKKNKKITAGRHPRRHPALHPALDRALPGGELPGPAVDAQPSRSKLVEQMDYYIQPERGGERTSCKINTPEEIKICDPACGSGHMLTYAFDLLYAIYEEEGLRPDRIPSLILQHNLYGIEIDERAGELAAFALTMKARAKDRRFFSREVQPNVLVMENLSFSSC